MNKWVKHWIGTASLFSLPSCAPSVREYLESLMSWSGSDWHSELLPHRPFLSLKPSLPLLLPSTFSLLLFGCCKWATLDPGLMAPACDGAFFSAVCLLPPKESARAFLTDDPEFDTPQHAARVGAIVFDCLQCIPQTLHCSSPLRCNAKLNSPVCRWEREEDRVVTMDAYYRNWILGWQYGAALIFPIDHNTKINYLKRLTGWLWPETRFMSNVSILDFSVMVF